MRKTPFFLVLIVLFFSCNEEEVTTDNSKSLWYKTYFKELNKYEDIYALSQWHENFDDTHLRVDSSPEALHTFKQLVADDTFLSDCQFENHTLKTVSGKKYFGSFPDFCGEEDCVTEQRIKDYETLINKPIAWAYFSNNWHDNFVFQETNIHTIIQAGRTPFIRLMPRSEFEEYQQDPIWKLNDIASGIHDISITTWANHIKNLHADVLVEFGTEVNGSWFSWNGKYYGAGTKDAYGDPEYPDGPEVFRDAYRHIIEVCNQAGADNITWFFHFDVNNEPNEWWNDPVYYYPGDDYIDWLGVSTYGPYNSSEAEDEEVQPKNLLERAHAKFVEISTDKPYAVLEFGVTEY